jgi:uncharacterized membrane-anchored protein YitT (DUF2179 family)
LLKLKQTDMNPLFQQIILNVVRWSGEKEKKPENTSRYNLGKRFYKIKVALTHLVKDLFFITIGITSAGFGLESFLLPNSFIDGGVTGISLLTAEVTQYPLPVLIVLINIPFIIMGYTQFGKPFALKSIFAITGLAIAIAFIHYPLITSDKLLVSVFGGFFLGLGIGFAVRGGGVLDGTEVLAIYLGKRTGLTIGDCILLFNTLIFFTAAYLLSIETALYSMLTYLIASKTVDYVVEGVEEYTGVTIVSLHNDEIRQTIIDKLGRGVTIYTGQRGFGKTGEKTGPIPILYSVMTRLEIAKLKTEVDKIDPNAFMVMNAVKDTKGGMIKKRTLPPIL